MNPEDPARIAAQLVELRLEHRDLDDAIARLAASIESDELTVKRLKKRTRSSWIRARSPDTTSTS